MKKSKYVFAYVFMYECKRIIRIKCIVFDVRSWWTGLDGIDFRIIWILQAYFSLVRRFNKMPWPWLCWSELNATKKSIFYTIQEFKMDISNVGSKSHVEMSKNRKTLYSVFLLLLSFVNWHWINSNKYEIHWNLW